LRNRFAVSEGDFDEVALTRSFVALILAVARLLTGNHHYRGDG
jgi:hypothetical protein